MPQRLSQIFLPMPDEPPADATVVGGGPAGLRAAEVLVDERAVSVVRLYEGKPSVGTKIPRGRTRRAEPDAFGSPCRNVRHRQISRTTEPARWRTDCWPEFGPAELRAWAAGSGSGDVRGDQRASVPPRTAGGRLCCAAGLTRLREARGGVSRQPFRLDRTFRRRHDPEGEWRRGFSGHPHGRSPPRGRKRGGPRGRSCGGVGPWRRFLAADRLRRSTGLRSCTLRRWRAGRFPGSRRTAAGKSRGDPRLARWRRRVSRSRTSSAFRRGPDRAGRGAHHPVRPGRRRVVPTRPRRCARWPPTVAARPQAGT